MLVFPQWRPRMATEGCTVQRWLPVERFAPYFARPVALPPAPQTEDEDSSGGSSPERSECTEGTEVERCEWRGCGASFLSVARLSAHVARMHAHAHRDGLFYCAWKGCARPQKGFNARYKMLVHVRTHTNERPHTCNQCQKCFSRAENLKIHLRSHSGEKPYVCPFEGCGKAYSNSSDRFKHTRTHTVDKPYFCKVPGCNKRYTDPSSLRKHVKTYKHYVTEDKKDSSDDQCRLSENSYESSSAMKENPYSIEPVSPSQSRISYSPTNATMSPLIPPYNPILPLSEPPMTYNLSSSYLEPYLRVPSYEMSYMEYSQLYEHTYKNYYTNVSYPVRPTVIEKVLTYEEPEIEVTMEEVRDRDSPERQAAEDVPLNLICVKKIECRPFEELVKRSDVPLDLSTKS